MEKLTKRAMELAVSYGACTVGVATIETLEGGPPSTDLSYVLPGAKSAISFAVSLDQTHIESWFNKQSHENRGCCRHPWFGGHRGRTDTN